MLLKLKPQKDNQFIFSKRTSKRNPPTDGNKKLDFLSPNRFDVLNHENIDFTTDETIEAQNNNNNEVRNPNGKYGKDRKKENKNSTQKEQKKSKTVILGDSMIKSIFGPDISHATKDKQQAIVKAFSGS